MASLYTAVTDSLKCIHMHHRQHDQINKTLLICRGYSFSRLIHYLCK